MIVAFGHESGVGKDTFARFVVEWVRLNHSNVEVIMDGFAVPIYELCERMYGWAGFRSRNFYENRRDLKEQILPLIGKSPRTLLIEIGQFMRTYDPMFWINRIKHDNRQCLRILTDLRDPYEFDNVDCLRVKIHKPGFQSSIPMDDFLRSRQWDVTIERQEGLHLFRLQAFEFCETHLKGKIC